MRVEGFAAALASAALLTLMADEAAGFFQQRGGGRRQRPPPPAVEEIDLYAALGVDEEASDKDIKSAYRKLSLKYHPDRNDEADAESRFREVSFAYEILASEEKKFLYDQGGMALVKEAEAEDGRGGGGAHDMFASFFGGGGAQRGNRGPDYQMRLRVTLEELYSGVEKDARVSRRIVCARCSRDGLSAAAQARCAQCGRCPNEVRMVHRQMGGFIVQQQEEVPSTDKCRLESKTLTAHVERGMQEGHELRFKYMSEQKPKQIPGDVVLVLSQAPHGRYERRGDDLHTTLTVSLKEALTGFTKSIPHLDGRPVELDREDVITRPRETIVLRGEGMPVHEVPSTFGDLHVTFEVEFPAALSAEQLAAISDTL